MELQKLTSQEHIVSDCLIFKHSTRCPISAAADREVRDYLHENPHAAFLVDVIKDRKRSQEMAKRYCMTHESPQIIVKGEVRHGAITKKALEEHV